MAIEVIVAIEAIEVIEGIEGIEGIFFSRRGRLRTRTGRRERLRTPDRTLHLQTVCSKLTAGETPASPVGIASSLLFLCSLVRPGDRTSLIAGGDACAHRTVYPAGETPASPDVFRG